MRPEFSRGLLQAISNTDVSVLYQNLSDQVVWSLNVPGPWVESPFDGHGNGNPLTEEGAAQLARARRAVIESGDPQTLEVQIRNGVGTRWFDIWIDADRNEEDEIVGLVTTAVETTDHKRREQTLRALLREVSHRSKNLLAIILSIAGQTGRYSGTIEGFLTRFRGRIQSLASSQDLVTLSNWRGADLRQLARNQIGRYCADPERNIQITGENPYLNPNAALHVGLALHELAVNSVSYGALTRTVGQVAIDVQPVQDGLQIIWSEDFPFLKKSATEKRFGSVALERVVPAALDGSAALKLNESRVEYRLFVPSANYEMV
jgi:two-component sensor histidine kinase